MQSDQQQAKKQKQRSAQAMRIRFCIFPHRPAPSPQDLLVPHMGHAHHSPPIHVPLLSSDSLSLTVG